VSIPIFSGDEVLRKLSERKYPAQSSYLAMYSSWLNGITKDPGMMFVPVDDHLVHRGDGVFEAIKIVQNRVYLLDEHLQRLSSSAEAISLALPNPLSEIKEIILECSRVTGVSDAVLRLYISRGPGGFTTNPYDSIGSQMYLIVTHLTPFSDEKYQRGVKLGRSLIPPKEPWLARIKTCNYLPNVMMKEESVDRKIDFTIGFDAHGVITEGSTENVVLVDSKKILVRPKLNQILKGTTMVRTFELAEKLVAKGLIVGIEERDLSEVDLLSASEVMMIGTTLDVLPVSEYEGNPIGTGVQGPVAKALLELLRQDMRTGARAIPLS